MTGQAGGVFSHWLAKSGRSGSSVWVSLQENFVPSQEGKSASDSKHNSMLSLPYNNLLVLNIKHIEGRSDIWEC